ncbi:MAG: hypothetical protein ABIQ18_14940 [Umezawaea sp.]
MIKRVAVLAAFAVVTTTACESAPAKTAADAPPAVTTFGPAGWGKLTPGMTKDQALATGDLGADPVNVLGGCQDHSFADGPKPDPARMAADAEVEQKYQDAVRKSDELDAALGESPAAGASADEFATHAERAAAAAAASSDVATLAAESTDRIVARLEASTASGGVSFGEGKLRLIGAPPAARTAEDIGRGSTEEQLKKAYEGKGLVNDGGRYSMPVTDHAGWKLGFDVTDGKVTYLLLLNLDVKCA